MSAALPEIRPPVLSVETVRVLDEYLRFRHVVRNVRNVYSFEFDPQRINYLVQRARPCFEQVRIEVQAFADLLDRLAKDN